jgi:TRAP-type C4-dicarboxylate transport system substrate-binding protein
VLSNQSTIEIAGYQGTGSILSASLLSLAQSLEASHLFGPINTALDVTAQGESAAHLFQSVNSGARQLCYVASGYLTALAPDLAVLDLPFTVTKRTRALAALDQNAGQILSRSLALHSNYQVLGYWDNGFRHISNAVRPIHQPADCVGLKIRTLDSAIYRESLNALGFEAVTTDVSDLMRVIRSGEMQAQENPLTNYSNFKIYEHHPYLSLTGHFFGVLLLACNQQWFASLSEAQQQVLQEACAQATAQQRALAAQQDAALQTTLVTQGSLIVSSSQLDLTQMQRATVYIVERERQKLSRSVVQHYLDALGH